MRSGLTYDRLQIKASGYPGGLEFHASGAEIDDLVKLCQFYNLTADYLVGLSDQPQKIK